MKNEKYIQPPNNTEQIQEITPTLKNTKPEDAINHFGDLFQKCLNNIPGSTADMAQPSGMLSRHGGDEFIGVFQGNVKDDNRNHLLGLIKESIHMDQSYTRIIFEIPEEDLTKFNIEDAYQLSRTRSRPEGEEFIGVFQGNSDISENEKK